MTLFVRGPVLAAAPAEDREVHPGPAAPPQAPTLQLGTAAAGEAGGHELAVTLAGSPDLSVKRPQRLVHLLPRTGGPGDWGLRCQIR